MNLNRRSGDLSIPLAVFFVWQLLVHSHGLLFAAGLVILLYWFVHLRWKLIQVILVLVAGTAFYSLYTPDNAAITTPATTRQVATVDGQWQVRRSWEGRYGYGAVVVNERGDCFYVGSLAHPVLRGQRLTGTLHLRKHLTDDGCQRSQAVSLSTVPDFGISSTLQPLGLKGAGLVLAATVADKGWLPRATKQQYNLRGIGHLLAVSGLHFGLVALVLWGLVGFCCLPLFHWYNGGDYWQRPLRFAATGSLLTLYAVQTGWPDSVLRAWLMVMIILLWRMGATYRQQGSAIIGLLGWGLALLAPDTFAHAGMQMSFWITLALVLGGEIAISTGQWWYGVIWVALVPTAITQVIAFQAGFVSGWHAILNNMVAIPFFSLVLLPLCWCILVAASMGVLLPRATDLLLWGQDKMLTWTLAIDGKASYESALVGWLLVLSLILAGLLLTKRQESSRLVKLT